MQSRWEDRNLLLGCMCIARTAPHFLWDLSGGAAEDYGDQSLGQALLDATAGIRGENPAASGCPAHCRCQGLCLESQEGRKRREGRGPGKEEGSRGPGTGRGLSLVFWALRGPRWLGSRQGPPPGTRLQFICKSPGQGPSGLPAAPSLCTLVCMSSNAGSQCHSPPPPPGLESF